MMRQRSSRGDALGEGCQPARILEWVAGRDQPPHPVETDALQGQKARRAMGGMRRIERASEEPDAHAGRVWRQDQTGLKKSRCGGRAGQQELIVHGLRNNPSPQATVRRPLLATIAAEEMLVMVAFVRCRGRGI